MFKVGGWPLLILVIIVAEPILFWQPFFSFLVPLAFSTLRFRSFSSFFAFVGLLRVV